jgi:type VI secretion system FHA domain protein
MATITLSILRCPDGVPPEQRRSTGTEITIGRGRNCTWVLEDPDRVLSKQHCVIEFYNGGWQVRDLSTNGLFVNSQGPVGREQSRLLFNGDRLQFGSYEIEAQIAEDPPAIQRTEPTPDARAPFADVSFRAATPLIPADFELDDFGPAVPDHSPSNSDMMPVPKALDIIDEDVDLSVDTTPPSGTDSNPAAPPVADEAVAPGPDRRGGAGSIEALLAGTGLPGYLAARVAADPESALRQAGEVLRAAVTGIRTLLMARSDIKGEFRIAQTVLQVSRNNPLKFARTDEQALADLLDPHSTGSFGMQEAIDDLKRHEVAMLAAMQAAVKSLLELIDPTALEAADPGGGLLPGARERRLWDAYRHRHAELVAQFGDDFDSVFGRAFARAYEVVVNRPVD